MHFTQAFLYYPFNKFDLIFIKYFFATQTQSRHFFNMQRFSYTVHLECYNTHVLNVFRFLTQ